MVCNGMDYGRFWGFKEKHTLLQGAKQSPYFHVALTTKKHCGYFKASRNPPLRHISVLL